MITDFLQASESFAQKKPPVAEGSGATAVPHPTFPAGAMPMPGAVLPHSKPFYSDGSKIAGLTYF